MIAPVEKPGAVHDALASIRDRCEATVDDIVQLSRQSSCFEGIRSQLKANEDAVLKVEPPPADEDTEKPLTKAELKQLRTAWTSRYSSSLWLEPQQTPCDQLVCRLYREFHGECMTLMLVNTVRTVLMDKKAPSKRHVPVGLAQDGMQVSVTLQADERNVTMGTVIEYYLGLTVLMNAWSFCGSHLVVVKCPNEADKKVPFFEYGRGAAYVAFALRMTMERAPPGRELQWLESKDLLTRSIVVTLTREGQSAGEALKEALRETTLDWKTSDVTAEPDATAHFQAKGKSGNKRSRSRRSRSKGTRKKGRTSWPATQITQQAKGGKRYCAKFQRGECKEPCPDRNSLHSCWLRLKAGGTCNGNHAAADCTNKGTMASK